MSTRQIVGNVLGQSLSRIQGRSGGLTSDLRRETRTQCGVETASAFLYAKLYPMTIEDIPAVNRALKKEFKAHAAPIIELIEAQTHDPFCVLVGTILSARTKDACTAGAVKRLFATAAGERFAPSDLERLSVAEIEKLVYPVGFFRDVTSRNSPASFRRSSAASSRTRSRSSANSRASDARPRTSRSPSASTSPPFASTSMSTASATGSSSSTRRSRSRRR